MIAVAAAALLLASCGGGRDFGSQSPAPAATAAPLALNRPAERPASVLMPLDEAALRKAIANYTVNKEREPSAYRLAGADLNGDGVPEALVLFEGKDWCVTTGCSLAVFKSGTHGYRAAFRTVRVKAPVIVAQAGNDGWRHLIVMTGGGPAPVRRVLLRFGDGAYPSNALLQPEVPERADVEGEVAMPAAAAQSIQTR